jgi:nitrite reductase/ring-hydroxylating ferredoxin subunit
VRETRAKEIKMNYVSVAVVSDIPPGQMKTFKAQGKEVLLANVDGKFHALNNKCPHAHFPLGKGKLSGCTVTCPMHHAQFNVETGKNLEDAKVLFIKMKVKDAGCYSVKVEGDNVLVSLD